DRVVDIGSRDERFENVGEHLRIGTRGQRTLLGAAQLCRRDGLHGLGDLACVDHAADAAPDVEDVCHYSVVSRSSLVVSRWTWETCSRYPGVSSRVPETRVSKSPISYP